VFPHYVPLADTLALFFDLIMRHIEPNLPMKYYLLGFTRQTIMITGLFDAVVPPLVSNFNKKKRLAFGQSLMPQVQ